MITFEEIKQNETIKTYIIEAKANNITTVERSDFVRISYKNI